MNNHPWGNPSLRANVREVAGDARIPIARSPESDIPTNEAVKHANV
jgi:hypothetical protein